jgi:hypothetical protein
MAIWSLPSSIAVRKAGELDGEIICPKNVFSSRSTT